MPLSLKLSHTTPKQPEENYSEEWLFRHEPKTTPYSSTLPEPTLHSLTLPEPNTHDMPAQSTQNNLEQNTPEPK